MEALKCITALFLLWLFGACVLRAAAVLYSMSLTQDYVQVTVKDKADTLTNVYMHIKRVTNTHFNLKSPILN